MEIRVYEDFKGLKKEIENKLLAHGKRVEKKHNVNFTTVSIEPYGRNDWQACFTVYEAGKAPRVKVIVYVVETGKIKSIRDTL